MTANQLTEIQNATFQHLRGKGWFVTRHSTVNAAIGFRRLEDGGFQVKGWAGRARKPAFFYRFPTQEKAEAHVAEWLEGLNDWAERQKARRAESQAVDAREFWTVGDVGEYSWGYDQTNVDFFQVTRVSRASVWIRPIGSASSDHGQPGGGVCQPRRGRFTGEECRKRGGQSLSMDHGILAKWDGKACYTSSDR